MSTKEDLLYEAVNSSDINQVKELLQKGANVNQLISSGRSILGRAVQIGDIFIIQELLRSEHYIADSNSKLSSEPSYSLVSGIKCDINIKDHYDRTPLHYAAEHGRIDILHMLLKRGSRVDVSDSENITPLHLAVSRGHDEIVMTLLKAGSQVNRKTRYTSDKTTALHLAASRGFTKVVKLLIQYNAKIDALDSSDRTPLLLAVSRAHYDVVNLLIDHGAIVNTEEIHGYTPLAEAIWQKDVALVSLLLKAGAKLTKSHHLLHYCVLHRNIQLVELLLQNGCLVNVRDDSGDTPLHIASRIGDINVIQLLISHGANVNNPSGIVGSYPLHEVVEGVKDNEEENFTVILQLLLAHKCHLDSESFMAGDTPLYRAILLDKFKIAAILIRYGADVNKGHVSSCNIDNLCLAQRKGNFILVKLLVYAGFNLHNTPWLEIMPSQISHNYHPHTLKGWLIYMKQNPFTLSDLCRLSLRRRLSKNVYSVVSTLLIPERIRRYLLLEDLE